jgi:hypothetical protein
MFGAPAILSLLAIYECKTVILVALVCITRKTVHMFLQ